MDTRPFNILSLCSGIGGLELGVKRAVPHARTVCFVEREAYCCEVLATRLEEKVLDEAPVWTDVCTFDGRPWRGVVDCLTAGYPCQPFSTAGKRLGTADPRHLWPHVARIIGEVEPRFVFCENVDRHLSVGFRDVVRDLQEMGYVVAAGTFSAAEVGAPHRRQRLYFLASLDRGRRGIELADSRREFEHADESRWWQRKSGEGSAELERSGTTMASSSEQLGGGSSVGNAERTGLEGTLYSQGTEVLDERRSRHRAFFPPGPDELAEWSYLLAELPEVEPALCRDAHGISAWNDRLRALGNGVVPQVAEFAWRTLYAELRELSSSPS